jgi:hypothetical protein
MEVQSSSSSHVPEIGIVGFDPLTGDPLKRGVTCLLSTATANNIQYGLNRDNERVMSTSFKGSRQMFEIVGTPWLDPTQSFFLAHVTTIDTQFEILPDQHLAETQQLFCDLPTLVRQWMKVVVDAGIATPAALTKQIKRSQIIDDDVMKNPQQQQQNKKTVVSSSSPSSSFSSSSSPSTTTTTTTSTAMILPSTQRDRAIWVISALLNPIQGCYLKSPTKGLIGQRVVCPQDLRPAMLACQNDFDRLLLASSALRRSIDSCQRYKQSQQSHR